MFEVLTSLPEFLGAVIAMALSTAVGLALYIGSSRLVARYRTYDLKDPASSIFRVVGILVGLMLSLSFADVVVKMRAIETALAREAVAIADMYLDLDAFDAEATREIRADLVAYTRAVLDDEWTTLAEDELSRKVQDLKGRIAGQVLSLEPATPKQEQLWSRIVADMDAISDHRLIRLDNALASPPIFIYVVMIGYLVTIIVFGAYPPQPPLLVFVGLYAAFIGFVLFLILALSDPFQGAFSVDRAVLELLAEEISTRLERAGP